MTGRIVGVVGFGLLLAVPLACSSFNGTDAPVADQPDATAPVADASMVVTGSEDRGLDVALGIPTAYVIQGSKVDIPVTLTRHPATQGAVTVTVSNLPAKVTADPLVIPAQALTGALTLHADPDAIQGSTKTQLVATEMVAQGATAVANPIVFVRGPGGALDTTFAGTGYIANMFPGIEADATDAKPLSDGSVLVSGRRNFNSVVSHIKADGTFDAAFGAAGTVSLASTDSSAVLDVYEGTSPAQGFIYALDTGGTASAVLHRMKLDGTVDTSFGTLGAVPVVDGQSGSIAGVQVFALPTGNALVLVAHSDHSGSLTRWLPSGQIDITFGSNGVCALPGAGKGFLRADGSVLTAYQTGATGYIQGCTAGGQLDAAIAPGPSFQVTVNGNFNDVALEKDGSFLFLLTGQLTHVSAAYVYDAGFKGLFEQNYSSVVVQADGGILMGGGGDSSFVVGHIPPPGGVQQFGTSGVATFPADTAQLNKLVVQPDGRVLAIGKSGGFFGAILRFWP